MSQIKDRYQPVVQRSEYFTYTLSWGTDNTDLVDDPIPGPVGHYIAQPYANQSVLMYVSIASASAVGDTVVPAWRINIPSQIYNTIPEYDPVLLSDRPNVWKANIDTDDPDTAVINIPNLFKAGSDDSVVCLTGMLTVDSPGYGEITIEERTPGGNTVVLTFPTMIVPGVFEFGRMYFSQQPNPNSEPISEIAPQTPFYVHWKGNNIVSKDISAYTLTLNWKETTCVPNPLVDGYPYSVSVTDAGADGQQQRYPQSGGLTTNYDVTFILVGVAPQVDPKVPPQRFQIQGTLRVTPSPQPLTRGATPEPVRPERPKTFRVTPSPQPVIARITSEPVQPEKPKTFCVIPSPQPVIARITSEPVRFERSKTSRVIPSPQPSIGRVTSEQITTRLHYRFYET